MRLFAQFSCWLDVWYCDRWHVQLQKEEVCGENMRSMWSVTETRRDDHHSLGILSDRDKPRLSGRTA